MTVRPLPIRVEPYVDEPWSNYLDRVAMRLGLTPRTVRCVIGIHHGSAVSAAHWGIAMTDRTRDRCALVLNLEPPEVEAMQMQRFAGRALDFQPDTISAFDPGTETSASSVHEAIFNAGWMYRRPSSRACPVCLREQPDRWYLSWRLPWHLHCGEHNLLIGPVRSRRSVILRECMQVERALLERAYSSEPSPDSLDYFADVCATADSLIAVRTGRVPWHVPSAPLLRTVLVDAVHVADGDSERAELVVAELRRSEDGYHHVLRALRRFIHPSADGSRSRLMSATGSTQWRVFLPSTLRAPALLRAASSPFPPRWLPQQLPMDAFVGDLSDLLYPHALRDGRHVAALGCLMLRSGCTLLEGIDALGNFWRCNARRFQDPLHRLESEGREELFWRACSDALTTLETGGVDYAWRVTSAKDPTFHDELTTECWVPYRGGMLQRWLVQEWACGRLLVSDQNVVEQRVFGRLDAGDAAVLLASADRVLARRVSKTIEVA